MKDPLQDNDEALRECIEFHGHFCPGLAIGFKAARELMRILGASRAGDEELFAIVETDACGADAVQVITGCTFGKGNLFFLDHGKHAFTLGSRKRGKAVRACLRSAETFDSDFVGLFEKMRSKAAVPEEKERFFQLRETLARRILDAEVDRLFAVKAINVDLPPKARVVRSAICSRCKEPVRYDYLENIDGAMLCTSCRKTAPKTH